MWVFEYFFSVHWVFLVILTTTQCFICLKLKSVAVFLTKKHISCTLWLRPILSGNTLVKLVYFTNHLAKFIQKIFILLHSFCTLLNPEKSSLLIQSARESIRRVTAICFQSKTTCCVAFVRISVSILRERERGKDKSWMMLKKTFSKNVFKTRQFVMETFHIHLTILAYFDLNVWRDSTIDGDFCSSRRCGFRECCKRWV